MCVVLVVEVGFVDVMVVLYFCCFVEDGVYECDEGCDDDGDDVFGGEGVFVDGNLGEVV